MSSAERTSRPVYLLGAGFSRAINDAMPVTNDLGQDLQRRLRGIEEFELRAGQSFEDWLTVQITPLPFLERHTNARRAAVAERVIAEMAHILDHQVAITTAMECPLWLWQLTAIWDAERAAVLTFNYDTLLERAVNTHPLATHSGRASFRQAFGDQLVYPAPPAPPAQFLGDTGSPHDAGSFQILKLHGSLAWHWTSGDSSGSTLVREREKHIFGSSLPMMNEADFSGARNLDRFLIPPVLSKDGYYGNYLSNSLWRSAQQLITQAKSLTLIGYSLPSGDRITSELVAGVNATAEVQVVDLFANQTEDGVLSRLERLDISAAPVASGSSCVPDYVRQRMDEVMGSVQQAVAQLAEDEEVHNLMVAFTNGWNTSYPTNFFVLVWDRLANIYVTRDLDRTQVPSPRMSYNEIAINQLPAGMHPIEDFLTVHKMLDLTAGGRPLYFRHESIPNRLVVIGASLVRHEFGSAVLLKWAPAP